MPEKVEIYIEGKDGLSRPAQTASRSLNGLSSAASSTGRALGNIAQQAAGFATAMIGLQALSAISGTIRGLIGGMISTNAEMETMQQSFKILLSDAAAAGGSVQQSQEDIGEATRSTAASLVNAQERMGDSAEDHRLAIAKLAQEFAALETDSTKALTKMSSEYQVTLSEMAGSHAESMSDIRRQLDDYNRDFARQSEQRQRQFDEEIARRQQRLAEELADIRRRASEAAKTAPERFLREREAARRNAEFLKASIAEEESKGTAADRVLLASLRQRLSQEEQAQKGTFKQFQTAEKAKVTAEITAAQSRAAIEEMALRERFDRERQFAAQANSERIAELQRRMAREDTEYAEALSKRKVRYAEDLAEFKEREQEKLQALRDRETEEQRQYARTVRDTQQALAAASASYGEAAKKAARATGGTVNQMKEMYEALAKYVDRPLQTAEERAAAMMEFIEKKAKETPFTLPQVTEAVRGLMAFRLNALDFLGTVGNVAAGMSKPLDEVVYAFGRLATGQMGEANEAFRRLGVNLHDYLKFDANGAIAEPIDQALAKVKAALDARFAGMMTAQMSTFRGIMSNLEDWWIKFQRVSGKPLFEGIKSQLKAIMDFLDANAERVNTFAISIGQGISDSLKQFAPLLKEAMIGFFDWVKSGKAEEDVRNFADSTKAIITFLVSAIRFGGDFVQMLGNIWKWLGENKTLIGGILIILGMLALFLAGPLSLSIGAVLLAILGIATGIALMVDTIVKSWQDMETFMGNATDAMLKMWDDLMIGIKANWDIAIDYAKTAVNAMIEMLNGWIRAWNALSFSIPTIDLPLGGQIGGGVVGVPQVPEIPLLDRGGIVTRPTLALLAGNSQPEAVLPLNGRGMGITINWYQQAPIYGFTNFEDAVVNAVERGQRRGRL